ncbi:MAG: SpoVK/Ycf46/Vps4 family AAA+-type ATPase [Halioglobus sp.]|jgi:SpoVK/Ycf46/Vps4 family AAA+-type ATPase
MAQNTEIEELKQAVSQSPENTYLRMLLIRKMLQYDGYKDELESQINMLLQFDPNNKEAKELLAQIAFDKGRTSTCIIILEELDNKDVLSTNGKLILAKAYLKEENHDRARELYEMVLLVDPNATDEDLDNAFRMRAAESTDSHDDSFLEKPDVKFADVGGLENVKKEIDLKIIKPLDNAELYATYGKKIGGGILLYGPPGCGKTFLAKATAGEINAAFINVSLNDILDMWHGNSEKNLHNIFAKARQNTPCVIFFDEIDALAAKRSDMLQSAGKKVINQFLNELDGIQHDNEGLLIVGATNTPWHLDSAFRRPGRFDRIIFVPPPDTVSKEEILKLKLKDKPTENIDFKKVAKRTKNYSGADINALIDIAVESKLEEAFQTGVPMPITTKDLIAASDKHNASTIDWFNTAKNYATFANQSGLYDDVMKYIKKEL